MEIRDANAPKAAIIMLEDISYAFNQTKKHISKAAADCNRTAEQITLIAVSKQQQEDRIEASLSYGQRVFGENRVQDALAKQSEISGVEWELIGHLQSNKVNQVIGKFERIQTVDSIKLLEKIQASAERRELRQKILIQVNSGEDPAKFGLLIDEAEEFLERALGCSHLITEGLMTIAPYAPDDSSVARRAFFKLRELRDRLKEAFQVDLDELSMGMSGDLGEAIEAGSTMIRVGTALFGQRDG